MAISLPLKSKEWRFMLNVSHLLQAAFCTISWPHYWAPAFALEWKGMETKNTDEDSTYKLHTDTYTSSPKTPAPCPALYVHCNLCLLLLWPLAPATVFITFLLEQIFLGRGLCYSLFSIKLCPASPLVCWNPNPSVTVSGDEASAGVIMIKQSHKRKALM